MVCHRFGDRQSSPSPAFVVVDPGKLLCPDAREQELDIDVQLLHGGQQLNRRRTSPTFQAPHRASADLELIGQGVTREAELLTLLNQTVIKAITNLNLLFQNLSVYAKIWW